MKKSESLLSIKYADWIKQLKEKVQQVQLKAAVNVNYELLNFYWELGSDIVEKQKSAKWGEGFLRKLSKDLSVEFPNMKGFSKRNLELIRSWYLFWSSKSEIEKQAATHLEEGKKVLPNDKKQIAKQAVSQMTNGHPPKLIIQIPWSHNIVIISKCKDLHKAHFYVRKTVENSWSRSVLVHQIESNLFEREGKALSNFEATLPKVQSDLAKETLKDLLLL